MRLTIALCALLLVGMTAALAQESPSKEAPKEERKEERKTEERKTPKADEKAAEKPAVKKLERGDSKAEKLLKKAWDRVQSAETAGLERFKAGAKITVDAKAVGMGERAVDGTLLWTKGKDAAWIGADQAAAGNPGQMAEIARVARALFEPYLAYVVGFEDFGRKFKEVNFKMGEDVKGADGKKTADTVIVTYPDDRVETYTVAENKVATMVRNVDMNGEKATMTFTYTYEDLGKKLRLSKVAALTKVDMSGVPGAEEGEAADEGIEGSIEFKKYGKAGDFDIAVELAGSLKVMIMEFPTKLTITDPKVNKDVTDEDLKPLTEEAAVEDDKID